MSPEFRRLVVDRDEVGLEVAYFGNRSPHLFAVDWRADDAEIVEDCAACLEISSLTAEWREDNLHVAYEGREIQVPLAGGAGDRHTTLCTLNDLLAPHYQVRLLVCSHGSDTLGFAALAAADWQELEQANPLAVAENFIDPRQLPNVMTELRDRDFPAVAKARFERLLARGSKKVLAAGAESPPGGNGLGQKLKDFFRIFFPPRKGT